MSFFPLVLNMDYFPVLVVGGGRVAFRKTRLIYSCAEDIRVVSSFLSDDFLDFLRGNNISYSVSEYSVEYLAGIRLCVAATDSSELNSRIGRDCLSLGILSNEVSSIGGQVSFSSFFEGGGLLASFFTYGGAPVVARQIKEDFRQKYSSNYVRLIDFISRHRDEYNRSLLFEFRHRFWEEVFAMLLDGCSDVELRRRIDIMLDKYSG